LKSAGLLQVDLRRALSPHQKGWITRQWNKAGRLLDPEKFVRVKVPKHAEVKTGTRIKDTAFFPVGKGKGRYDKKRDEVVREWESGGKRYRTREPVDQRAAKNIKRLKSATSSERKGKKVKRIMIRRAGAVNPSAPIHYTPELAERYLKELGGQIYREQVARWRSRGLSLNEARKRAKAEREDVIDSLFTIEIEEA
jgi:hypothetical protein